VRDTQQSTGNPNPSPLPSVSTGVLQRQQDILEHTAARLDGNQTIAQRIGKYVIHTFNALKHIGVWPIWLSLNTELATATTTTTAA